MRAIILQFTTMLQKKNVAWPLPKNPKWLFVPYLATQIVKLKQIEFCTGNFAKQYVLKILEKVVKQ